MWPLSCQHPFKHLLVAKDETKVDDMHPEDPAIITTYHFSCAWCGASDLTIKYASMKYLFDWKKP